MNSRNHIKTQKSAIFLTKNLKIKMIRIKNIIKLDTIHYTEEHRGAAHSICNLKCILPKEIPIIFHNGFNYDYHFIIKELAEEFKKQFTCLGENK